MKLGGTLLAATAITLVTTDVAFAQEAVADDSGLEVIIVTAQKREQNVQDVPIAVTALSGATLEANRVVTVHDLTGLAPGLTVTQASGGQKIPSFTMRGAVSTGLVPGSDKQISIYLDGVYISSPRGSVFDLPDVQRIEVLRGPQGTLFGRNATAGAVSISTRNPTGEVGVKASATLGNFDHFRFHTGVELPQIGPFSGYFSYVHNYKRGDIRNVAAGQLWDRTLSASAKIARVQRSPEYLGTTKSDSWFAALKFESGDFTTVNKYDRSEDHGTPRGTGLVGYNADVPLLGNLIDTLIRTQPNPVPLAPDGKRPKTVSNAYAIPNTQQVQGHSLTSTYQISDDLSVKNILAYRKAYVFSPSSIDGVSSLVITPQAVQPFAILAAFSQVPGLAQADPATQAAVIGQFAAGLAPLVGSPYIGIASQAQGRSEQYSDEIQLNYNSDFLTVTAGALWFHAKDWVSEHRFQNTISFSPIAGGVMLNRNYGANFNKATSLAVYAQFEFHLTPQLDVVAGGRVTRDSKAGTFTYGPDLATPTVIAFKYRKTKPSYLIGVNYKPNDDTLIYGKFSTAYVSGGSVAGIPFAPETVASWEAGLKTEMFDRKLRANLALFHAKYKHAQGPSAPTTPEAIELIVQATGNVELPAVVGTFVADLGDIKAKGFEFDLSAAPLTGLTFGGSVGYTDTDYTYINPLQIGSNPNLPRLTFRPDWTGTVWAQYDTPPLGIGDAYLSFRGDAFWQDRQLLASRPEDPAYQTFAASIAAIPAYWTFNARVALRNLDLGGVTTQVALWGKNLSNERYANYGLNLGNIFASANYVEARSYGMDLTVEF
jgi:iron complex outermembrane receptor protein